MASNPKTRVSSDEYLALERSSDIRHEYSDGEVFSMAGASRRHNRIVTNLVTGLDNRLRSADCNVYSNDMRVKVAATGLYTYPDVVVTCGEEEFEDERTDTLLNPIVLVEVLSDSTEAYDRGRKLENYQKLDSLRVYILVAQDKKRVEQYVRQKDNQWVYSEAYGDNAALEIVSLNCSLSLTELYSNT
jgi:Uma2 family endonuclease